MTKPLRISRANRAAILRTFAELSELANNKRLIADLATEFGLTYDQVLWLVADAGG